MIAKEKFVSILEELREIDDFKNRVNEEIRRLKSIDTDFLDSDIFCINHQDGIIDLLPECFGTLDDKIKKDIKDTIEWWIFDCEYGRNKKYTTVTYEDGNKYVIDTSDKLYDDIIKCFDIQGEE